MLRFLQKLISEFLKNPERIPEESLENPGRIPEDFRKRNYSPDQVALWVHEFLTPLVFQGFLARVFFLKAQSSPRNLSKVPLEIGPKFPYKSVQSSLRNRPKVRLEICTKFP